VILDPAQLSNLKQTVQLKPANRFERSLRSLIYVVNLLALFSVKGQHEKSPFINCLTGSGFRIPSCLTRKQSMIKLLARILVTFYLDCFFLAFKQNGSADAVQMFCHFAAPMSLRHNQPAFLRNHCTPPCRE